MEKETFLKGVQDLDTKIKDYYLRVVRQIKQEKIFKGEYPENLKGPICDGIVSLDDYFKAPIRVLWLMKEAYEDGKNGGGGWSITEDLRYQRSTGKKRDSPGTFRPIIFLSHAILHGIKSYDHGFPKIEPLLPVLRQIAFVNLWKLPAGKTSSNKELNARPEESKDLVMQQLLVYKPDIVICGGTYDLILPQLKALNGTKVGDWHFRIGNTLIINTSHPASRRKGEKKVDQINIILKRIWEFKGDFCWGKFYPDRKGC